MVPPMLKNTFSLQVDSVTHPPYSAVLRKNNRWASLVSHEAILTPDPDLLHRNPWHKFSRYVQISLSEFCIWSSGKRARAVKEIFTHTWRPYDNCWSGLRQTSQTIHWMNSQTSTANVTAVFATIRFTLRRSFRGRFINFHILKNFAELACFLCCGVVLVMKQRLRM